MEGHFFPLSVAVSPRQRGNQALRLVSRPRGCRRVGFVDVASSTSGYVLTVSVQLVLSLGDPGTFDDNGQFLGDVLRVDDEIWMYYVAFQKVAKVKSYVFSGLAVSKDGDESITRASCVPVMDRAEEGIFGLRRKSADGIR